MVLYKVIFRFQNIDVIIHIPLNGFKKFAEAVMGTKDVRVDSELNKHVWSKGVRNVPRRVRVRRGRQPRGRKQAPEG